jgi:coenzyme F420-reducing hydrogenase gamma subunit
MTSDGKIRLAVWKFASCDGCQLTLLNCEAELMALLDDVEIAYFPEASRAMSEGPYDLSLVEGSITTPHDAERIHGIRRDSKLLATIGACATAGGIQALRNFREVGEMAKTVYASPQYLEVLRNSTAIADHVRVDFELRGCPIDKRQLLDALATLRAGGRPVAPDYSVCIECKRNGNTCVLVATGEACLGPVTHAGCGAICPSFARGCFGCFGPKEDPNTASLTNHLRQQGAGRQSLVRQFRSFNAAAPAFRRESEALEQTGRRND